MIGRFNIGKVRNLSKENPEVRNLIQKWVCRYFELNITTQGFENKKTRSEEVKYSKPRSESERHKTQT